MWLGFLPLCYLGVLLLARRRMPQLDARLWLDGIIAALTTAAVTAAIVFGAVHARRAATPPRSRRTWPTRSAT